MADIIKKSPAFLKRLEASLNPTTYAQAKAALDDYKRHLKVMHIEEWQCDVRDLPLDDVNLRMLAALEKAADDARVDEYRRRKV
jgi:ribosomal protein L29